MISNAQNINKLLPPPPPSSVALLGGKLCAPLTYTLRTGEQLARIS